MLANLAVLKCISTTLFVRYGYLQMLHAEIFYSPQFILAIAYPVTYIEISVFTYLVCVKD